MTKYLILIFSLSFSFSFSQKTNPPLSNKNKFFVSWGWNRDAYTKSNIHFKGDDYNFRLHKVVAKDLQKPFDWYFLDPTQLSIPQYNARVGYYINDHYSISLGFDHMKYVMQANQIANISGTIGNLGTAYDGTYENTPIKISPDFLKLEHTNGLNYLNTELRRLDKIAGILNNKIEFNTIVGAGVGIMYPKSDVTLLNFKRNDQWHFAGYGVDLLAGVHITFLKHFFVQYEVKGGYINMPDVITTEFKDDRAKQDFFFMQRNISFGSKFALWK